MATHTTTNYTISQPTGVDGQVRLEAGTIDKTISPEPAPVAPAAQPAVLPVAHTHAPGEEIDPKVIKQRKEQQKQYVGSSPSPTNKSGLLMRICSSSLEKELDREAQLDEKEIKAREKDAKGVSKEEEKAHDVSMCCQAFTTTVCLADGFA